MQGGTSICYEGVTRTCKELQGSARSPISAHLAFQLPQSWEDNLVALSSSQLCPCTHNIIKRVLKIHLQTTLYFVFKYKFPPKSTVPPLHLEYLKIPNLNTGCLVTQERQLINGLCLCLQISLHTHSLSLCFAEGGSMNAKVQWAKMQMSLEVFIRLKTIMLFVTSRIKIRSSYQT